jgi:hypothetical protein
VVAETVLSRRGKYEVIVIHVPVAPPPGKLDSDLAALTRAGVDRFRQSILVH